MHMKKLTKFEIQKGVKNAFSYFTNHLYDIITYDHPAKIDTFKVESKKVFDDCDVSELRNFTENEIRTTPGTGIWDKVNGKIGILLSPAFISLLPDDFELECILNGEKKKVSEFKDYDFDTRFGCTAYGFWIDEK